MATPIRTVALLAVLVMVSPACRPRWPFERQARPPETLTWVALDPAALEVVEETSPRIVRYHFELGEDRRARRLELQFRNALDGAKVEAFGQGPHQTVTLLEGKRFGGNRIDVPLAPVTLGHVEVVVHRHFRPLPIIARIRLGRGAP